jgi:hypothetical protein
MSKLPQTDAAKKRTQQLYDGGKLDLAIEYLYLDIQLLERELEESMNLYDAAVIGGKLLGRDSDEMRKQRDMLAEALGNVLGDLKANNYVEAPTIEKSEQAHESLTENKL